MGDDSSSDYGRTEATPAMQSVPRLTRFSLCRYSRIEQIRDDNLIDVFTGGGLLQSSAETLEALMGATIRPSYTSQAVCPDDNYLTRI